MKAVFYDHLVVREEIDLQLEKYAISDLEKTEIIQLIDETLHHEMLNLILSNLPEDKHEEFLNNFHSNPENAELLDYIKQHSGKDLAKLIKEEAQKVKKELLKSIKESSQKED